MLNLFRLPKLFFLPLALSSTAFAAEPAGDALSSLLQAEKNFAKMSREAGIRDSFLANLADDAIVFDPGPVNGRKLYTKRSPSPAQLIWEPIFADVSSAGDMGYTTGPWEYKKTKSDARPAAYGQFLSVWKRQSGRRRGKLSWMAASIIPHLSKKRRLDRLRLTSSQVALRVI